MKYAVVAVSCLTMALVPTQSFTTVRTNFGIHQIIKGEERSTNLYMGTNRRSRRKNKKQTGQSRPNTFYEAIQEADGKGKDGKEGMAASGATPLAKTAKELKQQQKQKSGESSKSEEEASVVSSSSISDAQAQMNKRPDVSTIIVDEETGIERIQQGKFVMDVVTRKAVQYSSLGPEYRLAQMFPGVPPEVREKHRFDWSADPSSASVPYMIDKLRAACQIETKGDEGASLSLPPHPQVTDEGLDFVLANRDLLGFRMKKTLGRLKLRAQSQFDKQAAFEYRALWKHFLTLEDHISAPFRQMLLDAEGRVGPNFGNLDLPSYCGKHLYERAASYLVLKGMVAHWEKKVRDAEYVQATPQTRENFLDVLMVGDPKRYLPDPPIIYRYDEVVRIALMAQNMTSVFVNDPNLFDDLPPEIRFVEKASFLKGGTALRQFMNEQFCPEEGITPEALREGLRRLDVQMSNMQIDPYGDLKNVIGRLCEAIAVGTPDEIDPYNVYLANLDKNGPGYFQTYTFDHDQQSMVRFLDNAKVIQQGTIGPTDSVLDQISNEAINLFGIKTDPPPIDKKDIKTVAYKTPEDRACGRPHNLGWLNLLGDEEVTGGVPPSDGDGSGNDGDDDDDTFESDNWREVIVKRQGTQQSAV